MATRRAFQTADFNRKLCQLFTDVFDLAKFCAAGFIAKSLKFSPFLRWVNNFNVPSAVKNIEAVEEKGKKRSDGSHLQSFFGAVENALHRELGTEQMRQVIRNPLSLHFLSAEGGHVFDVFYNIFV